VLQGGENAGKNGEVTQVRNSITPMKKSDGAVFAPKAQGDEETKKCSLKNQTEKIDKLSESETKQ